MSESGSEQEDPVLTFDDSAVPTVLSAFAWDTDGNGTIVDRDDDPVEATDGEPITTDELAGVVGQPGDRTPLRDDFPSLVDHVKNRGETA